MFAYFLHTCVVHSCLSNVKIILHHGVPIERLLTIPKSFCCMTTAFSSDIETVYFPLTLGETVKTCSQNYCGKWWWLLWLKMFGVLNHFKVNLLSNHEIVTKWNTLYLCWWTGNVIVAPNVTFEWMKFDGGLYQASITFWVICRCCEKAFFKSYININGIEIKIIFVR